MPGHFSALFWRGSKPSVPVPFGYKMGWFVVRSADTAKVAQTIGLHSQTQASWQDGIDGAYTRGLTFVTPPVNGTPSALGPGNKVQWIAIVGERAMGSPSVSLVSSDAVAKNVARLSSTFQEAQGFATDRATGYVHWIWAKAGRVQRYFAYVGNRGELLTNGGPITGPERKMPFPSLLKGEWQPSEADVMAVASGWSFDPSRLSWASGPVAFGLVGKL